MKKGLALVLVLVMALGIVGVASADYVILSPRINELKAADRACMIAAFKESIFPRISEVEAFRQLTLDAIVNDISFNAQTFVTLNDIVARYPTANVGDMLLVFDWVANTNPIAGLFTDRGAMIDQTMFSGIVDSGMYTDRGVATGLGTYPMIVDAYEAEIVAGP